VKFIYQPEPARIAVCMSLNELYATVPDPQVPPLEVYTLPASPPVAVEVQTARLVVSIRELARYGLALDAHGLAVVFSFQHASFIP
jgi:hypothetical protein